MKQLRIRTAALLLAAVLLFSASASALSAQGCVVLDAQTGRRLVDRNGDRQALMASTTKIMTALVVCQQCNVLDRVKIPEEAVGVEGSSMYLQAGEILTVQELLYGLMLSSGNDAAVALAIYCGGTVEGFVERMNDKARDLGLENTHFRNPNGLDAPGHYSTPGDLARLAAYAMEDPIFAQTVATRQITIGQRRLTNHNKLLWQVPGADGVKTGYTRAAGRILVSSATRDGRRLICVTMDDPDDWQDHRALLEAGFAEFERRELVRAGDVLGYVEVLGGDGTWAELVAQEDFAYSLRESEQTSLELSVGEFVYAPAVRNAPAGVCYVLLEGKAVGKIPVVFGNTVEQTPEEKRPFWKRWFSD